MAELTVREFGADQRPVWDGFVSSSPQGTIFSETLWLQALDNPFRLFGCYKGNDLVGGVAVLEDEAGRNTRGLFPLTPFQGVIFRDHSAMKHPTRDSLQMQITTALLDRLEAQYCGLTIANHYTFHDLRPFFFRTFGHGNSYEVTIRYTHVVDLSDIDASWAAMDDNTRWEIRKAQKVGIRLHHSDDFELFDRMQRRTFERQNLQRDIPADMLTRVFAALRSNGRCRLYLACNPMGVATSGVLTIWDNKRAYYLMGASETEFRNNGSASLTLWNAFQDLAPRLPEIDLVGCNSPRRGEFKAGFGGKLRHYFIASLRRGTATAE